MAANKKKPNSIDTKLAVMANDLGYIKGTVAKIENRLVKDYVTRQEFDPIKKVIYGMVGLVLVSVAGAILSLTLIK